MTKFDPRGGADGVVDGAAGVLVSGVHVSG